MKILFTLAMVALLLYSCDQDYNPGPSERNVVSNEQVVLFEEVLLLLNVKTSDNTFMVVESIDSVKIFINDFYWANVSSVPMDTSKVTKFTDDNMFHSNGKINYLVKASQDLGQTTFLTAGDFAAYLNRLNRLKPGEYACFIESFQVTFNDQTTQKYYPLMYKVFKIEDKMRSAFVGEFEFKIY